MEIELKRTPVGDVFRGYVDSQEEGVVGYDGRLNIRPKYQREFIYNDKQRDAVIDTLTKGFPLNTMYWVKKSSGEYELLDGQQRTVSICQYINGDFSHKDRFFHNLTEEEKDSILNYELMVYVCEGTESEQLDWFNVINIAGEELTKQEIRNAVYTGAWLEDAKRYFSKSGAVAQDVADGLMTGKPLRQDYLETVLRWISSRDGVSVEEYMAINQHQSNASELWLYFNNVIHWVRTLFPKIRRSEMQKVQWGNLYNEYHKKSFDPSSLEGLVHKLMIDEDVTRKTGIYYYVFDGKQKHLNIRSFNNRQKREAYERQDGICAICKKKFSIKGMEADHITPWVKGGETVSSNCQMLCVECNRIKSSN